MPAGVNMRDMRTPDITQEGRIRIGHNRIRQGGG